MWKLTKKTKTNEQAFPSYLFDKHFYQAGIMPLKKSHTPASLLDEQERTPKTSTVGNTETFCHLLSRWIMLRTGNQD